MGFFNEYPYTDFHEMNLDWIISKVKELDKKVGESLEEYIKEYVDKHLDKFALNATYDEPTETLTLYLDRGDD